MVNWEWEGLNRYVAVTPTSKRVGSCNHGFPKYESRLTAMKMIFQSLIYIVALFMALSLPGCVLLDPRPMAARMPTDVQPVLDRTHRGPRQEEPARAGPGKYAANQEFAALERKKEREIAQRRETEARAAVEAARAHERQASRPGQHDLPNLVATADFLDPNRNQILDAEETAELLITLTNQGRGEAFKIDVEPHLEGKVVGVTLSPAKALSIESLAGGESRSLKFRLKADEEVPAQRIRIQIRVKELNGFEPAPVEVNLATQPKVVSIEGTQRPEVLSDVKPIPVRDKEQIGVDNLRMGTKYAVLIGIDNYLDSDLRSLSYAEQDIKGLYSVLCDPVLGGYKPANVFLMTPKADQPQDRPTRNNILMTLKWLSENLQPEDSLLFAFCGHGETEDQTNFLIPLNGLRALPQDTSIRLPRLFEWLDACPARRQVVMLDACHSGGLAKGERGDRGMQVLATSFSDEIDRIGKIEGRAILSSCSSDEVSYEDDKLMHGVFSHFMLIGLKNMKADRDNDRRVTVYELGIYTKREVQSWCKQNRKSPTQTPRLIYNETSGDIELVNQGRSEE